MFGVFIGIGLGVVAVILGLVCWIAALIRVWKHADWNTEKKALWFLVIFVAGTLGAAIYYFVTGRKRWGIASVAVMVAIPVLYFAVLGSFFVGLGRFNAPRYNAGDSKTARSNSECLLKNSEGAYIVTQDDVAAVLGDAAWRNTEVESYFNEPCAYQIHAASNQRAMGAIVLEQRPASGFDWESGKVDRAKPQNGTAYLRYVEVPGVRDDAYLRIPTGSNWVVGLIKRGEIVVLVNFNAVCGVQQCGEGIYKTFLERVASRLPQ